MKNKKVIIWDFDGPIVDSWKIAFELTDREFFGITEEVHRNLFNGNILEEISKLKKKTYTKEEDEEYRKNYWERKLNIPPVNGIDRVIKDLAKNHIQVVNSSAIGEMIKDYLKRYSLEKFFSDVYGREIKSKVEKFNLIFDKYNVGPEDCVLITDTVGDMLDAKEVGMESIVVTWGYQRKEHFAEIESDLVFAESPQEILDQFSKNL